jgi:hypothetical protein
MDIPTCSKCFKYRLSRETFISITYAKLNIIDAEEQSVEGANKSVGPLIGEINFIKNGNVEGSDKVNLGMLRTDEKGRLIVIGGPGLSCSPIGSGLTSFVNNDGWYDSVSDGPVNAHIQIGDETPVTAEPAWVLVAPPSYAPGVENIVTWYDQAFNVNAKNFNPVLITRTPSFTRDIYPVLKRTVNLQWVLEERYRHHGGAGNFLQPARLPQLADKSDRAKQARQVVLGMLTKPNTGAPKVQQALRTMPRLFSGLDPDNPTSNEYPAVTEYQYTMIQKWADGDFDADWSGEPDFPSFDDIPLVTQPDALTQAALEGCIGMPFYPGIEATYVIAQAKTYEAPFRISRELRTGFLTESMALPWQADFLACGDLWWPAQRPVAVTAADGQIKPFSRGIGDYADMVKWWAKLGFVVQKGSEFVEDERQDINGQN